MDVDDQETVPNNVTGSTPSQTPPLRRETIFFARERQRFSVVVALCSLAGIGMGFGLGHVATQRANCALVSWEHGTTGNRWTNMQPAQDGITWLGVQVTTVRNTDETRGARITRVIENSPAENAGLRVGEVITMFDDTRILSSSGLVRTVRQHRAGEAVTVVTHGGWRRTNVKLGTISHQELQEWNCGRRVSHLK